MKQIIAQGAEAINSKESEKEHFSRLNNYYNKSRHGYSIILRGAKHFGYHPNGISIPEKQASILMQDKVAEKLNLINGMKILDAGCGRGVTTIYFSKKYNCFVEGIDMVKFELDIARESAIKNEVSKQTKFSYMNYQNMSFQTNYFDAIFTLETLSHASNLNKALKEIYRVLKPGGKIAFFEYTMAQESKIPDYQETIVKKVAHASAMDSLHKFRHDNFHKKLNSIGFINIKTENITENMVPTLKYFYNLSKIPYFIVKITKTHERYPNVTAAVEFYKMEKQGLFRYNIFTANKRK